MLQSQIETHSAEAKFEKHGELLLRGGIVDMQVKEGDAVEKGQTLMVLEAIKIKHQLKAGCDGMVESINTHVGDQAKIRQLLVTVKAEECEYE